MNKKEEYKERLSKKTVAELKAIYTRAFGKDLLRGSKREMICTLASSMNSPAAEQRGICPPH